MPKLLEADPATGTLVPIDPTSCPACGQATEAMTFAEPALFFHGGYGASRTTTIRHCRCGWTLVSDVTETNPRR